MYFISCACAAVCNLLRLLFGARSRSAYCVISLSSLQLLACSVCGGENRGGGPGPSGRARAALPRACSVKVEEFCFCVAQHGSHWPHVAINM